MLVNRYDILKIYKGKKEVNNFLTTIARSALIEQRSILLPNECNYRYGRGRPIRPINYYDLDKAVEYYKSRIADPFARGNHKTQWKSILADIEQLIEDLKRQ